MTTPIQHHQAGGIHPGAFVQSNAPSTTDMQDGVLWVDTSTPVPHQVKLWRKAAGVWQVLSQAPSVAPTPGVPGQSLQLITSAGRPQAQWADNCCTDIGRSLPTTAPAPNPVGPSAVPTRCGAAMAMADYLLAYYDNVHTVLNGLATKALTTTIVALVALLAAACPEEIAFGSVLDFTSLARLAGRLLSLGLSVVVAPTLTDAQKQFVLRAFYCALPPDPNALSIDDGIRDAWCDAITASSIFTQLTEPILVLLSHAISLSGWQQLANIGAAQPSGACTSFDCGLGRGLRGGGEYGALMRRAIQGGALRSAGGHRAIEGSAYYGALTRRAIKGGAKH